eukprot:GFUD01025442.1.p1 GENE.GFUD01025442.1~~GFUD01025442.1.p1  ORF type:complete len:284 (+),score=100.29 GFUD01025442.1:76-927(+)
MSQQFTAALEIVTAKDIMIKTVGIENGIKENDELTKTKKNEAKITENQDKDQSTLVSKPADDSPIIKMSEQTVRADVVVKNITANGEAGGRQVAKEEQEKKRDPETTEAKYNELKSMPKPDKALLKSQFKLFSKHGDKSADGSTIKLNQSDKWFKQAGVIKQKGITNTDTSIAFRKVAKKAIRISFVEWNKYLDEIATTKKMDVNTIKTKLVECGEPGFTGGTKVAKSAAIDRLTDTSKYGGAHKERFDSSGKGRGKEGREDAKSDGYVAGYKNKKGADDKMR